MSFFRSYEPDAPTSPLDQALYTTREPGWMSGIPGQERPVAPGSDNGILAMVVMLLVLVGLNMRHVRRLLRTVTQDLLSVRRRSNVFDDHTAKETRTILILLLQLCCFEGILLFLWLWDPASAHSAATSEAMAGAPVFYPVAWLSGLAMVYYIFQLTCCGLIGYTFADHTGASQWRRGLNASSVLLGIFLAVPTLVSLFYPAVTGAMLWLAASLFILSRLVYIAKGFRIFYTNFPSLLYFILYLCTIEIVPLISVYLIAMEICNRF